MPSGKRCNRALRKTKPCRFDPKGECLMGAACNFAHGDEVLLLPANLRGGAKSSQHLVKPQWDVGNLSDCSPVLNAREEGEPKMGRVPSDTQGSPRSLSTADTQGSPRSLSTEQNALDDYYNANQVVTPGEDEIPPVPSVPKTQGYCCALRAKNNFHASDADEQLKVLTANRDVAVEGLEQAIFNGDEELAVRHSVSEILHHTRALGTRLSTFLELEAPEQTVAVWDEVPMGHSISENHNGTYKPNQSLEFAAQSTQKAQAAHYLGRKEQDAVRARRLGATVRNTFLHFDAVETWLDGLHRCNSAHGRLVPDHFQDALRTPTLPNGGVDSQVTALTRRQVHARTAILGPALGHPVLLGAATKRTVGKSLPLMKEGTDDTTFIDSEPNVA